MASHVNAVEDSLRPPILRLPVELQLHILSFLSIRLKMCRLPRAGDYRSRVAYDRSLAAVGRISAAVGRSSTAVGRTSAAVGRTPTVFRRRTHKYSASTCYRITITNPIILSLRCTNVHFSMLIPLTHELLLEVERWHLSCRRTVLACCVCLRLLAQKNFAVHAATKVQDTEEDEEDFLARHRFCADCGFAAYPHPHPVLPPRRQQRRLGTEPRGLTAYAPGTKIGFPRHQWGAQPQTFDVWVWCLDCRLLKTGVEAGSWQCRLFCKECCKRMGCESLRVGGVEHVGYEGMRGEIERESERKNSRLEAGQVYVVRGSSLLLRNKMQGGDLEQEQEEDDDDQTTPEWHHWFDNLDNPAILSTPLPSTPQT